MDKQVAKAIVKHFLGAAAWAVAIGLVTQFFFISVTSGLNFGLFYQGLITMMTGAMVAIFLAVFYSNEDRIKWIKNQPGALTLYLIVLLDLTALVITGLFIKQDGTSDVLAVVLPILLVASVDVIWMIARLISISLRRG